MLCVGTRLDTRSSHRNLLVSGRQAPETQKPENPGHTRASTEPGAVQYLMAPDNGDEHSHDGKGKREGEAAPRICTSDAYPSTIAAAAAATYRQPPRIMSSVHRRRALDFFITGCILTAAPKPSRGSCRLDASSGA